MALDATILASKIAEAFAAGVAGATSVQVAGMVAAAYDAYARTAQSCAGLPPTLVNTDDLRNGLEAAMADSQTAEIAAGLWTDAVSAYWKEAAFGISGIVVLIPGKSMLKANLAVFFTNVQNTLVGAAQQIAAELDLFTKQIVVTDAIQPIPTGCTAPIV